ncbi:molybdate ABC transporter permease subunit [soil metagenome]
MITPILLTLKLAFWTSVCLALLGVPLAWMITRHSFWGKRVVETLLLLPLVLPPTVLGFYLLLLFGDNGPVVQYVGLRWAFRFEGILVGSLLFNLPFALAAYRETFRGLNEDLLQTARTLGASRPRIWREIVLPLSWPGLMAGTLLVFAHTLGEFGVVLMIGASIPGETQVVSIYLFELVQALRLAEAHRVSLLMVVLSFGLLYLLRVLETRWRSATG